MAYIMPHLLASRGYHRRRPPHAKHSFSEPTLAFTRWPGIDTCRSTVPKLKHDRPHAPHPISYPIPHPPRSPSRPEASDCLPRKWWASDGRSTVHGVYFRLKTGFVRLQVSKGQRLSYLPLSSKSAFSFIPLAYTSIHLSTPQPQVPKMSSSERFTKQNGLVKMTIAGRKIPGWEDSKFLQEYVGVHAAMTTQIAAAVPILRKYTQVIAIPHEPVAQLPRGGHAPWDMVSTLEWTSLDDLYGSFQTPEYKASAGSHKFADEGSQVGVLGKAVEEITLDTVGFEKRGETTTILQVFLAKSPEGDALALSEEDLAKRVAKIKDVGSGRGLLRYVANRPVVPSNLTTFFEGTPFSETDWSSTALMEQYWFPTRDAAVAFINDNSTRGTLFSNLPNCLADEKSFGIIGKENRVVEKGESD